MVSYIECTHPTDGLAVSGDGELYQADDWQVSTATWNDNADMIKTYGDFHTDRWRHRSGSDDNKSESL